MVSPLLYPSTLETSLIPSRNPTHGPHCTHFPLHDANGIPHPDAPAFAGSGPTRTANIPDAPGLSTPRGANPSGGSATSAHPAVISLLSVDPMAHANSRSSQLHAPRVTSPSHAGTSQGNGGAMGPYRPPGRASRKSRLKH